MVKHVIEGCLTALVTRPFLPADESNNVAYSLTVSRGELPRVNAHTRSELLVISKMRLPLRTSRRATAELEPGTVVGAWVLTSIRLIPLNVNTAAVLPDMVSGVVDEPGSVSALGSLMSLFV